MRRLANLLLLSGLLAACTPARHSIAPYDSDAVQAARLEVWAQTSCLALGGEVGGQPFTTDGCSVFPDRDWVACCIEHDIPYWCGGNAAQREQADRALQICMEEKGYPLTGHLMYLGYPDRRASPVALSLALGIRGTLAGGIPHNIAMTEQNYIYEGSGENFQTLVVENSKKGPVLNGTYFRISPPIRASR